MKITASPPETVPLPRPALPYAAGVLARAFFHNPLYMYFLPEERQRRLKAPIIFGTELHLAWRHGTILTTPPGIAGIIIWQAPPLPRLAGWDILRSGAAWLPLRLGPGPIARLWRFMSHSREVRRRRAPEKHAYLELLGVEPARQGQGIGTRLVRSGLAQLDTAGLPVYLETHNPDSLPFYERLGFRVVDESTIPGTAVKQWAMLRL